LPKEQARIIGINYELTEEPPPPPKDLVSQIQVKPKKKEKEKAEAIPPKMEPPKPALKTFAVVIRRTAVLEETERVKAVNEKAAREAALATIKDKRFDVSRATMSLELCSVDILLA